MLVASVLVLGLGLGACRRADDSEMERGGVRGDAAAPRPAPLTPGKGSVVVDERELRALCLLSALPQPPKPTNSTWKDEGIVEGGDKKLTWLTVEGGAASPEEAHQYVADVQRALINRAKNSSAALCNESWGEARLASVVSVVLRVAGNDEHGRWFVYGALANAGSEKKGALLENVSRAEAIRKTLEDASKSFGAELAVKQASPAWLEAAKR